jgi:hypothetical protein
MLTVVSITCLASSSDARVNAQEDGIIISDADYVATNTTGRPDLENATIDVTPRIITEYAEFAAKKELRPPTGLPASGSPRIIIEYAEYSYITDIQGYDVTPPYIGEPAQEPPGEVSLNQSVNILVNVTDSESQVKNVTLSYSTDNGFSWNTLIMSFNLTSGLYNATIPGQPTAGLTKYSIKAYDYAENFAENDNAGQYFTFEIIPEFPASLVMMVLMIASLLAAVSFKRKHSRRALNNQKRCSINSGQRLQNYSFSFSVRAC